MDTVSPFQYNDDIRKLVAKPDGGIILREKLMKSSVASLLIASTIFTYNMNTTIKADETETVPSTEESTELIEEAVSTEESSEETAEEAAEQDLLVESSPENAPEQEVQQEAITEYNMQTEADETAPAHESQDDVPVEEEDETLEPLEEPAGQSALETTEETPEPPSEEVTEEASTEEAPATQPEEGISSEPVAEQTEEVTPEESIQQSAVDEPTEEVTSETSTEELPTEPEEETSSEPVEEPTGEETLEESTEQPTVEAPTGEETSEPTVEVPSDEPMEEEVTDESSAEPSTEEPAIEYDEATDYGNEESGAETYSDEQPLSEEAEKETSEVQSVNRQNYYRYDHGNILEGISLSPGTSDEQLNLLDKRVNRLMSSKIMPEDEVDEADILEIEDEIKNEEGVMASTDRESLPDTGEADYTFLYGTTLLIAGAILLFITRRPNNHKCK